MDKAPPVTIPKEILDTLTPAPDPTGPADAQAQFSPDDLARVEQIRSSQTWDYLERALRGAREALLCTRPKSTEELWRVWGRIEQLSDLLHGGPMSVLEYSKMAERRRDPQPSQVDGEVSHVHVHTYQGE